MDYDQGDPPDQAKGHLPEADEVKQPAIVGDLDTENKRQAHEFGVESKKGAVNGQPVCWVKVNYDEELAPRVRHGHRAVALKDLMIVFGGGNEGIFETLNVYNCVTNQWSEVHPKGDKVPGLAAFAMTISKHCVYVMGGMIEYGKYTNDMYELQLDKWIWQKVKTRWPKQGNKAIPSPRLGHSIVVTADRMCFVFGGLANGSKEARSNIPIYLNDIYQIDLRNTKNTEWAITPTVGTPPSPRESHSAVILETANRRHMIIYGGMNGSQRLGDVWILDLMTMTWHNPILHGIPPAPRSLHTACLVNGKMFVFGGWVPSGQDEKGLDTEWKCSNSLACLNIDSLAWEDSIIVDKDLPRPRAGHCAAPMHNRIYIWSGREGYRKAWNNQICLNDMWYLELDKPPKPEKITLTKSNTNSLEISWTHVLSAENYLVQIQKVIDSTRLLGPGQVGFSPLGQRSGVATAVQRGQMGGQPQLVKLTREPGSQPQILRVVRPGQPVAGTVRGAQSIGQVGAKPTAAKIIVTKSASGQNIVANEPIAGGPQGQMMYERSGMGDLPGSSSSTAESSHAAEHLPDSAAIPSISTQGTTYTRPAPQASHADESDLPHNLLDEPPTPQPQSQQQSSSGLSGVAASASAGDRQPMQPDALPQDAQPGQPQEMNPEEADHPDPVAMDPAAPPTHIDPADPFPSDVGQPATGAEGGEAIPADPMSSKTGEPSDPMQNAGGDPMHQPGFEPRQPAEGDVGEMLDQSMLPQQAAASSSQSQPSQMQADNIQQEEKLQHQNLLGQAANQDMTQMTPPSQQMDNAWLDVGILRGNQMNITHFFTQTDDRLIHSYGTYCETGIQAGKTECNRAIADLQPGTAYRVRYCGINHLGIGPFSDYTILKTSVPGFPGAPSAIKISKVSEGAHLSWEPPLNLGQIVEYSVYLAVRNTTPTAVNDNQLAFMRVYAGPQSECIVTQNSLDAAFVDSTAKPAIIFRIAAKNDKGYGPATQVRWLQDQATRPPIAPQGQFHGSYFGPMKASSGTPHSAAAAGKKPPRIN